MTMIAENAYLILGSLVGLPYLFSAVRKLWK